jgi:hypothetical protein
MTTLADFIQQYAIYATPEPAESNPNMDADREWNLTARHWRVTLQRPESAPMYVPFSQGSAHTEPPTAADVLDCLASDAATVENARDVLDFAAEMGFDLDSHKNRERARRTFETIQRQSGELREFLGDDAFETLLWNTERL